MSVRIAGLPENVKAPRTDAIYNCHAYPTKVPLEAIRPFIEAFTEPGELVVDFFAGSGMTGLAAIKAGRNATLSDISALGRHIALGYLTRVEAETFANVAEQVIATARKRVGNLYLATRDTPTSETEMVRTVWSFTYRCPRCSGELIYFEHITPSGSPPTKCPYCRGPFARRTWQRGSDEPVQVVVRDTKGRLVEQPVKANDRDRIEAARLDKRLEKVPSQRIGEEREMFSRSGLAKAGLLDTKAFFSPRNAIALLELWQEIEQVNDDSIQQKLKFAFTAILSRASRRYQWGPKRPLNAQNQTYYIAPIYYEWNIFELFRRKVTAAIRASEELFNTTPLFASDTIQPTYTIASADRLAHLTDSSVDYVFTDPPFGSNIYYSDMSLFHEAWIGSVTDPTNEAVVHTLARRRKESGERYERLLRGAFAEGFRVLKPGRYMSVVFGNSSGRIWGMVQRALRESGFDPAPVHVAVLDKGQRSVKGLNSGSEGVVTVDLILTVRKPAGNRNSRSQIRVVEISPKTLILDAIASLKGDEAQDPSHIYARILRRAIQQHLPLDDLHLGDVLVALRDTGFSIDHKTGRLVNLRDVA